VALVEQEIDAMLFELNGKRRALRNLLDNLNVADTDFVASGRALFGPNFSADNDAGFLREAFQRLESFRRFL
jgi:hypothetical protein